jgi:hypothetical protein
VTPDSGAVTLSGEHSTTPPAPGKSGKAAVDYSKRRQVAPLSGAYRETTCDARLRAVAEHVRACPFGPDGRPA